MSRCGKATIGAHPPGGAQLTDLADTLRLAGGRAGAIQTGLLRAGAVTGPGWLRAFGEGYFRSLGALPAIVATRTAAGGYRLGLRAAPAQLTLLRFTSPYLAASRGGRELRYPIAGGLLARGASGSIAFGHAPEGDRVRIWVEVAGYWPRLGLGPPYILTQAALHRVVTVAYLRRVAAAAAPPRAVSSALP